MPSVYEFSQIIDLYFHEPYNSLLNGIIFGIKPRGNFELYQKLLKTGLLHIAVLSGMNLTLLSSVISSTFYFLGRKVNSLLTILIIIIFVEFVGPQAPIFRAAIMAILTHVAIIYGKQKNTLYLLFLSAVFSLIFKPQWIKSISFQLSYLSTLGIILFSKTKRKRPRNFLQKLSGFLKAEFMTSVSAQIFTAPLIFIKFKQISLIAPITNILVAPVIAPLMVLGFLIAFLGKINYLLGLPIAYTTFGFLKYITLILDFFSEIPYGFIKL